MRACRYVEYVQIWKQVEPGGIGGRYALPPTADTLFRSVAFRPMQRRAKRSPAIDCRALSDEREILCMADRIAVDQRGIPARIIAKRGRQAARRARGPGRPVTTGDLDNG